MSAQAVQLPALPLRAHTILGVCEGLGEDFGVNPLWFRVPLAAGVLWSPLAAIGIYFGLGVIVLASRLLFPKIDGSKPELVATSESAQAEAREQREFAEAA